MQRRHRNARSKQLPNLSQRNVGRKSAERAMGGVKGFANGLAKAAMRGLTSLSHNFWPLLLPCYKNGSNEKSNKYQRVAAGRADD
jgi:hypothetical protein